MKTMNVIKGTMLAVSFALLMMAANMADAAKGNSYVPALKDSIRKGDVVSIDMLMEVNLPSNQVAKYIVTDIEDIIGKEAIRSQRSGYALYKKNFREVPVVRKGSMATVIFKKAGIILTTEGLVMNDAEAGGLVKVMSSGSRRMLQGYAQKNGTIMVN